MPTPYEPVNPKQSFPALEEQILERWRSEDVFAEQLRRREGSPVWNFYEGPPTANGKPGSQHVFSRTFKDIYPRYKAMSGHYVPRKAGWDCHGLPVELEVEKQLGISSKAEIEALGIDEFNRRCRESVFQYVGEWNRMTERIGFWVDLENPYVTLTNDYMESVWWSLRQHWDKDRLYLGHKVVPYCPRCGTALSSHEVALGYKDIVDPSAYVRLPVTEPTGPLETGDNLLVWTTTPWTLISHAAVAAGEEIEYSRVRPAGSEEVLVIASGLVDRVAGEEAATLTTFSGAEIEGTRYEAPFKYVKGEEFGPLGHSVLLGDFVTTEDGTGLVHTALAFGEDDYRLGESYGMRLQNPVRLDGTFDPDRVPAFAGKLVYDHNPEIVEALRESGRLFKSTNYEHAYPHCWRCDTALIYYAKSSWYLRTSEVRDRMLAVNEKIGWHPEHIKHGRFGKWLEGNVDWALSRERYWGTPLPIWECGSEDCEERYCAGSIADLREHGGAVPDDLHRPYIDEVLLDCEGCGGTATMKRVPEVIDTWYDSGAMPFAQHHYPFENEDLFAERFPADFICEGIDQTRGWFYSLLAESVLLFDRSSYHNCVCLGLILDPEGQKMSKSKGNMVEPFEVIDEHGADAFRWYYLTAQQPWAGYRFSSETVGESVRQFLLTLWNTYSFYVLYANADGVDAGSPPSPPGSEGYAAPGGSAEQLDRWALARLQATITEVRGRLDDFDSTGAGAAITAYVDELSNWYVRVGRRRFWEGEPAALGTLRHCLTEVTKLLAPFVPFTADAIYRNLSGGSSGAESVHLADFPVADPALVDPQLEAGMDAARRAVELGRAARGAAKMKMRQPLAKAVIVATEAERRTIEGFADVVEAELNVKALEFVTEEAELASYEVKPNFRTLGPRFGKSMPQVAAAVAALDAEHLREAFTVGREIGVTIGGRDHPLAEEDVSLVMQPLDGYQVETAAGRAVALALELDEALIAEGLAREVVRAVQNARKESGLEISDRIELGIGGDPVIVEAAQAHEDYVAGEVLAERVSYGAEEGVEVGVDGRRLIISLAVSS